MARRRLTIKHVDPWSVLKFGTLANIAMLAIFLLVMTVVWFIIDRLALVDQICGIATDIGFTRCGLNAPNVFRALIMLGLLWVVVQTAVVVFLAFLHNLIADLTGGVELGVADEPTSARAASSPAPSGPSSGAAGAGESAGQRRAAPRGQARSATGGASRARRPSTGDSATPRSQPTSRRQPTGASGRSGDRSSGGRSGEAEAPVRRSARQRPAAPDDDQLFGDR